MKLLSIVRYKITMKIEGNSKVFSLACNYLLMGKFKESSLNQN